MKIICLLIFLALAGTAWGDNWQNCSDSGAICDGQGRCTCLGGERVIQKGHCPHCGAKFTLEGLELHWPNRGEKYYTSRVGMIYFCPNGHIFWEKD